MGGKFEEKSQSEQVYIAGNKWIDISTRSVVTSIAVAGTTAIPEIAINNMQAGKSVPGIAALRAAYLAVAIKGTQHGLVKSGLLSNGKRLAAEEAAITHDSEASTAARYKYRQLVKTGIAVPATLAITETACLSYLANSKLSISIGVKPELTSVRSVSQFSALGFFPRVLKNYGNAAACMLIQPVRDAIAAYQGDSHWADITSVVVAGAISTAFTPLDVITKLQVRGAVEAYQPTGKFAVTPVYRIGAEVIKSSGVRALFRGAPLSFAMNTIVMGIIHLVGNCLDQVAVRTQPERTIAAAPSLFPHVKDEERASESEEVVSNEESNLKP